MSGEVLSGRRIAVTGARTFLGTELLRLLDGDSRYHTIVALDISKPEEIDSDLIRFESLDLTVPTVGRQLTALLSDYRIDTVVHGAFLTFPTHARSWGHEVEDVGTMHVLDACAASKPERLVQLSTTLVYGARPGNPNFLSESTPLAANRAGFISDKVRADQQVGRFAANHPDIAVAQLRFAPILGPTIDGLFPRFFQSPVAPLMMGYDPLMQFVHEHDALIALKRTVDRDPAPRGAFNVVGRGVLPYSTVLALLGRVPVPIPYRLARTLARAAWSTQLGKTPPALFDFLRYMCVADGGRAERELGFRAQYNQKQILIDFLGLTGEDGTVDLAHAGVS